LSEAEAVIRLPIPARLNVALAIVSTAAAGALLWLVSRPVPLPYRLLGAIAFSYVNNTVFSLLHEAVHCVLHPSARVNSLCGRFLAAFFPTSFTLQRLFHLGHHRRNRSAAERFDYITPGENVLLKNVQWYGILTGLYWLLPPLSCILYLLSPRVFSSKLIQGEDAAWSRQSGTDAMVADVERLPAMTVRAEIVFAIAWQAALFLALDLTWSGWLLCYAAFAVNWSSLQYADHAWSPLDPVRGAWNLRVNRAVQWIFLNYHHHGVHHENPKIPWIHLPRFIDDAGPRPSFLRIYLSMWKGPRPLPSSEVRT
jgi:fatty acid desaturase